jgi:ABC-2 type transport system permease protein
VTAAVAATPRPVPPLAPALLCVAALGARQTLAQRVTWLGRVAFLVMILLIFERLWGAVAEGGLLAGLSPRGLLWYLALTEWIVLGVPLLHLAIEQDVKTGDVANALTRPTPGLAMKVAEGLGSLLVRLVTLGVGALLAATLLAGGLPDDPRGLLLALPLGVLSGVLLTLLYTWVGLATFWLGDCAPVHWVVQKLCFLLGGLMLPLAIYPDWLRKAAAWTPFAPMLDGVGRQALAYDPGAALATAGALLGWTVVLLVLLRFTWSRALRRADGAGG